MIIWNVNSQTQKLVRYSCRLTKTWLTYPPWRKSAKSNAVPEFGESCKSTRQPWRSLHHSLEARIHLDSSWHRAACPGACTTSPSPRKSSFPFSDTCHEKQRDSQSPQLPVTKPLPIRYFRPYCEQKWCSKGCKSQQSAGKCCCDQKSERSV